MPQDPKQLLLWVLIALLEPADLRNARKHEGFFSFCSLFACSLFPSPLFSFFPSFLPFFLSLSFSFFHFLLSLFLSFFLSFAFSSFLPLSLSRPFSLFLCFSLSLTQTHTQTHTTSPENTTLYFSGKKHQGLSMASKTVLLLQQFNSEMFPIDKLLFLKHTYIKSLLQTEPECAFIIRVWGQELSENSPSKHSQATVNIRKVPADDDCSKPLFLLLRGRVHPKAVSSE